MQELLRVLLNKKCIIGFFVIFLLNGWINYSCYRTQFQREDVKQYETLISEYKDKDIKEVEAEVEAQLEAQFEAQLEAQLETETGAPLEAEDEPEALSWIQGQIRHILGYPEYLEYIQDNAKSMRQLSISREDTGYIEDNIDKTVSEFQKLDNIELQLDCENAMSAYIDVGYCWLGLLLCPIPVLLVFLEERKKGLWQFVYAMPGGRRKLAAKRLAILTAYTTVAVIMLELQRMAVIRYYIGSFGDLSRNVQSNPLFAECVLEINMRQYIILTILVRIMVSVCVTCIMWFLSLWIKNSSFMFLCSAIVIYMEYYAYINIDVKSRYECLKYINIFSFLDSGVVITNYHNLNLFGNAVGVWQIMFYGIPVVLMLLGILLILAGNRRPFLGGNSLCARILEKISYKLKVYGHTSLFFHEGYKLHVRQYAAVVILLFLFIGVKLFEPEKVYYDYRSNLYNEYMEMLAGDESKEKQDYLANEHQMWQAKISELSQKLENYRMCMSKGDGSENEIFPTYDAFLKEEIRLDQYRIAEEVVSDLVIYADSLSEADGNRGYVNKIGYNYLIGKKGLSKMDQSTVLILLILVMSLYAIMTFESAQNAQNFIRSTSHGRRYLLMRKSFHVALVSIISVAGVSFLQWNYVKKTHGLNGYQYAVQCIEGMEEFPLSISIGQMLVLVLLLRIFVAWTCSMMILVISSRSRNMLVSLIVSALVVLIPALAVFVGIDMLSVCSVLKPLGVTYFWNTYGFNGIMWCAPVLAVAVAGVIIWIGAVYGEKT